MKDRGFSCSHDVQSEIPETVIVEAVRLLKSENKGNMKEEAFFCLTAIHERI